MKNFIINIQDENQRVDKYIMKVLDQASKSFIYKMLRKKNIVLNDKKINGNEILKLNDEIKIFFSDETFDLFSSIQLDHKSITTTRNFEILYEDENIVVCDKPVGLLSQPDGKNDNLVSQIEKYLYAQNTVFKPGICNRLDRNTSGIIIAGKTVKSLQLMNCAIANREVEKIYLTIVNGIVLKENIIEAYLLKDSSSNKVAISNNIKGDYIKTCYKPLKNNGQYTLLEVEIFTGKPHQIRAHLQSIGHPIIGDIKYGILHTNKYFAKEFGLKNQLLHAHRFKFLKLEDPLGYLTNQEFESPLPEQFKRVIKELF